MLDMAKRSFTATQAFELRQALHIAILDALMTSRRWEPGDLVFQGGTSLHLAHGSPRFSEDLDFLVNSALKLDFIRDAVQTRLEGTSWLPINAYLTVSKVRDGHNPHAFSVSIRGPDVIGAVRVKIELWRAEETAISDIKAVVAPIRLARGPASGMQTFVPTADLPEIYADKIFALVARPYLKPRDVFDLHWLSVHSNLRACTVDDLRVRLAIYPNVTPSVWLEKAFARRMELLNAADAIATDLKRWLPSSWPMTATAAKEMAQTAVQAIEQGIDRMREIEADRQHKYESPRP